MNSPESCSRVPAGSPVGGEARRARWVANVSSRKRYSKTGIKDPFVHSVCCWFGLEYRLGGELECG